MACAGDWELHAFFVQVPFCWAWVSAGCVGVALRVKLGFGVVLTAEAFYGLDARVCCVRGLRRFGISGAFATFASQKFGGFGEFLFTD